MDPSPLPCLKEATWEALEHAVCRPLWPRQAPRSMAWLAFGFDHPDHFEFITRDRLPSLNCTEPALEAEAVATLRGRAATWQTVDVAITNGAPLRLLACNDDFFAAERILDEAFMQEAQRRLKARGVLVGVPRRGLLLAASFDLDRQQSEVFSSIVAAEFSGGESAPISPMLFEVEAGAIVAALETAPGTGTSAPAPAPARAADPPAARPAPPPAAPAPPKPPFYWWTSLPSWVRLVVGLLIGLVILHRILTELAISLLP